MKKKFTWKKAIYIVLGLLFAVALFSGIGYLIKSNSKEGELSLPVNLPFRIWMIR
jgi:HlyD family secretion protein